MNFNLHFGELHSDNSINDKKKFFENYIPKCYKVKRIIISFNCFSEYRSALAVNCLVITHCLEVSCKEDQITSTQCEISYLHTTDLNSNTQ